MSTTYLIPCCIFTIFICHSLVAASIEDEEIPLLPKFSPEEQDYQKRSWENLIGCSIATRMSSRIFQMAGQSVSEAFSMKDVKSKMKKQCSELGGVFNAMCNRVYTTIIKRLKKREKGSKITSETFLKAIRTGRVCQSKELTEDNDLSPRAGCRKRGDCNIHSHLSELVLEGDVSFRKDPTSASRSKIPPIIHLMFGMTPDWGGKPFGIAHYLCVKTASQIMQNATIFLYYKHEPKGKWWKKAKQLLQPVRVDPVMKVNGREIPNMAHVSDLLRLQALRDLGGIYMDIDVITIRSFLPLMKDHSFVMGQEGEKGVYGLCNAVMLSSPNSTFVNLWIRHYAEAYDPAIWSMHSVKLPSILSHLYPTEITQVNDKVFFYPLWNKIDYMFTGHGETFPHNIAMHLWESLSWDKYISRLNLDYIMNVDNNFNNLVSWFDFLSPSEPS
uniref:Alpha 1,4-glycosyltransferase domain-containing protein n=1 Tax=Hanusia phi TaxID=3032 RepID=A0A7S0EWH5_9CRYP|mmetsp:Transcript_32356/g.72671  ORF Transcript_32356/g.72671 Transcript_32356/m.72671 type:complete len:443 (+) Transcript_32356:196-1524(+)